MITDSITRLLERLNQLLERLIINNRADLNAVEADVQASNTGLTTINTSIGTTNTNLNTVNGNLDTIETDIETTNSLLLVIDAVLDNVKLDSTTLVNNTVSKLERIKGAANYSRTFSYYLATTNVTSIVHTGTTLIGVETVTETISYVNVGLNDFRVTTIIYS